MAAWIAGLMPLSRYCQQPWVARGLENGEFALATPDIHRLCIRDAPVDDIVGKIGVIPSANSAWLARRVALALMPMMSTDPFN